MSYSQPFVDSGVRKANQPPQVNELLKEQVDLRSKAPRYGHSALHRAALHGHHAVVKALLLANADVEEGDDEGGGAYLEDGLPGWM